MSLVVEDFWSFCCSFIQFSGCYACADLQFSIITLQLLQTITVCAIFHLSWGEVDFDRFVYFC